MLSRSKPGKRKTRGKAIRRSSSFLSYRPQLEVLEDRRTPATFTVNTTADDLDGGTLTDPAGPDGTLSLREAITVANLNPVADTINFNVPGTDTQAVPILVGGTPGPTAGTPLPVITDQLEIDGPSQSPFLLPGIELDGASAGSDTNGLEISGGSCVVKNLEIAHFSGNGVQLENIGNDRLQDLYIGAAANGGFTLGNGGNGVFINNVGSNTIDGSSVIRGSGQNGVLIQGPAASQNLVAGPAIDNMLDGIFIDNAPGNSVTFMPEQAFAAGAFSSGENGIHIRGPGAFGNQVVATLFGNHGNGIFIDNAPNNNISSDIGANDQNGILIQGVGATGNTVGHGFIGADPTGGPSGPNNLDGIRIDNAPDNQLAGPQIGGNKGNGIHILGAGSTGYVISGLTITSNGGSGIFIDNASGVQVSGDVIWGNMQYGILIQGSAATNSLVTATWIGLSPNGGFSFPNHLDGICIDGASSNMIGSSTTSERNIVASNAGNGVCIQGAATGNLLLDNLISNNNQNGVLISGAAATGNLLQGNMIGITTTMGFLTIPGPNGMDGIRIDSASGNMIGAANAPPNFISASMYDGIHIMGTGASGNFVQNNRIGLNLDGTFDGNKLHGVVLEGTSIQNNLIGGIDSGEGNVIAFNDFAGVAVFGDPIAAVQNTGNAILGNSIRNSGGLGIDLVSTTSYPFDDGVTMNTSGGPHSGPNDLQNYPVLNSALPLDLGTQVKGTFNSTPNTTFRIEFFGNRSADPSGFGQGSTFLGFANVTTDAGGNANFTVTVPIPVLPGQFISATATDPGNNTSEFSKDVKVSSLPSSIAGRYLEGGQWWVAQSTGSSFQSQLWATSDPNVTWVDFLTADFNQDGRDDFAARNAQTGEWWVALSTRSSFAMQVWTTWSTFVTWRDVRIGDFNGDGKLDIIGRAEFPGDPHGNWWIALNTGSSFDNQFWTYWNAEVIWEQVKVGDFNGDHFSDLAGLTGGVWWVTLSPGSFSSLSGTNSTVWTRWSTAVTWVDVQVGDFNGDGRDDIIGRAKEIGQWWLGLAGPPPPGGGSLGSFTNQLWTTWSTGVTWVDVQVGDFNGDGHLDIAGRARELGQWWLSLSNGSSVTDRLWTTWSTAVDWVDVRFGDFNNDGLLDIAGRAQQLGDWWVALSDGSQFTNHFWGTWSTGATWVNVLVARF